jgi:hypothetical protein
VIASYNGCSRVDTVRVLAQLLRDKAPNLHLVVHRDRDYLPEGDVTRYTEMVVDFGASAFITDFSDVEGHFLLPEHIHAVHPTISIARASEIIDQATTLTRDASIAAIINLRNEYALKRRALGGGNPNVGEIALEATREFDANSQIMRRGKYVLARVRLLLQQELGTHAKLEVSSGALASPRLRDIVQRVWPPPADRQ